MKEKKGERRLSAFPQLVAWVIATLGYNFAHGGFRVFTSPSRDFMGGGFDDSARCFSFFPHLSVQRIRLAVTSFWGTTCCLTSREQPFVGPFSKVYTPFKLNAQG